MKRTLHFETILAPAMADSLHHGLNAFAINRPKIGPPTTLWLRCCDNQILKVDVKMHDLGDWEEIGTLRFELVSAKDTPVMTSLPVTWSKFKKLKKLVYSSAEVDAECGFALCASSENRLVVLPGADVYTLAIKASFFAMPFRPENNLAAYRFQDI